MVVEYTIPNDSDEHVVHVQHLPCDCNLDGTLCFEDALRQLKQQQHNIQTVIDVGRRGHTLVVLLRLGCYR
jgi:hypothetical protein